MTDEDTNDRMERANRIREMREGRRSTPADDGDEDASDATADGGEAETEPEADEPDAPETTGEDTPSEDDAATDSTPTIDETVDPADGSPTEPTTDDTPEASQSAEAAAADTESETGAPTAGEPDDEGDSERQAGADDGGGSDGTADADRAVETSGFEFDDPTDDGEERGNGATAGDGARADEAGEQATTASGVAESVSSSDAAEAVDALSESGTFAIPDQATTVTEDDDQSMLNAEGTVAAARAAAGRRATHAGDRTRVLEFELGEERFCLDIEYIEEIVELENMTRVPNSPSYVEGVVDLRGQVTAIINPKDALAVDDEGRGDLIVVFDSEAMDEQGHLGWVVDEVRQVTPVTDEEVNESPDEDDEHINGIINREDEDDFIVWTTPDLALNSS